MVAATLSVVAAAALLPTAGEGSSWDPASVAPERLVHLRPAAEAIPAWESRVAEWPSAGVEYERLGRLWMRHGKEAGDDAAFERAEESFRIALQCIPGHLDARIGLAHAMAAQHRFDEAGAIALAIREEDPDSVEALALLADAALETGDYAAARALTEELVSTHPAPATLARLARLHEVEGGRSEAIELLERGAMAARDANAMGDRMSWYLMRLADLHLGAGRLERAAAHAEMAVRAWPESLGARVVEARVLAAQGRWDGAMAAYEQLIERMPHPEVLAALGDVYHAAGEADRAQRIWMAVLEAGDRAGAAEDRPMARFLADHDLRPEEAVARARRDLRMRPDVQAWDNLAWALLKAGSVEEAAEAMDRALAQGSREAALLYHAGMIASATGQRRRAADLLEEALQLWPTFDPLQAPVARAELERLRGTGA